MTTSCKVVYVNDGPMSLVVGVNVRTMRNRLVALFGASSRLAFVLLGDLTNTRLFSSFDMLCVWPKHLYLYYLDRICLFMTVTVDT